MISSMVRAHRRPRHAARCYALVSLLLMFASAVAAQVGGSFSVARWTVASGGESSASTEISLRGVVGAAAAGRSTGGSFALQGGFFRSPATPSSVDAIFDDGFE